MISSLTFRNIGHIGAQRKLILHALWGLRELRNQSLLTCVVCIRGLSTELLAGLVASPLTQIEGMAFTLPTLHTRKEA